MSNLSPFNNHSQSSRLVLFFFALMFPLLTSSAAAQQQTKTEPSWFADYLAFFTKEGGCWVASNAAYQSQQETTESYFVKWNYGVAKNGKHATLYGIDKGQRTDNFWEIRVYWDGESQSVRVDQFGHHGIVGHASLVRTENGVMEQEMVFSLPDGRSWKDKHLIEMIDNQHKTTSFDWEDERWVQKRSYIWERCTQ